MVILFVKPVQSLHAVQLDYSHVDVSRLILPDDFPCCHRVPVHCFFCGVVGSSEIVLTNCRVNNITTTIKIGSKYLAVSRQI